MNHAALEGLRSLHTAAIDARSGYEEARHDAEGRGMTPLFQEMIAIHTKNANDLEPELERAGEPSRDEGSFMSSVNRTIMSIRSLFGGLDESVLPGLIDGERRNISHYDHVLQKDDLSPSARELVAKGRQRLEDAIAEMQLLKERP